VARIVTAYDARDRKKSRRPVTGTVTAGNDEDSKEADG
jgi:hypothetical protein